MSDQVEKIVKLPKGSAEVGAALAQVYVVAKQHLADGWQAGADAAPIMAVVLTQLLPAMKDSVLVGAEVKADPAGVAEAFLVEILEALR